MRKHFYLVTEHRDEERVGLIEIKDSQHRNSSKNEETIVYKYDQLNDERYSVKVVSMGYQDFEDYDEYADTVGDVVDKKLKELDESHLEKAGI